MESIADRLRWLVEHRADGKERELSRRAGLTPIHVNKLLERGPENASGDTLGKIARAGGVHLDWLVLGEGPRDLPSTGLRVVYDERYPNKRIALDALRPELHPKVPPLIESRIYHSKVDPPVSHWMREILDLDRAVRWEEANPAEAEANRVRDRAATVAYAAEQNAKSSAAAAKVPGLRGPESLEPPPPKLGKKPGEKKK